MAQLVKNLLSMQETQVQSFGWEDFLEEENGNPLQYSCLKSPMDRKPGRLPFKGSQRVRLNN